MKIIFYNLGYGRGINGSWLSYLQHAHRFFYQSMSSQKSVLDEVAAMVIAEQPDIFTYAEVGLGAWRTQYFNQHTYLTEIISRRVEQAAATKYGESVLSRLPYHSGNGNGVISFHPARIKAHYLRASQKKLVYVCTIKNLTVFTVHLPLLSSDRELQLAELAELVRQASGDVIVCGDFNIFNGFDELAYLQAQTNLLLTGDTRKTYPSSSPKWQLDVFLYRFENTHVTVKQRIIDSKSSDHLPIVLEW